MSAKRLTILAAGLALSAVNLLTASPAAATAYCNLKPTADGFVALRAAPASSAKLVGRMTSRDEVLIGQGEKGDWIEVTWWRGDDRHTKGYDRKSGHGWVHRKLVGEECG